MYSKEILVKKTLISAAVAIVLAIPGVSAFAAPAGTAGANSGTQITLSSGVNGGSVIATAASQQSASLGVSTNGALGGTLLGQSAGTAGTSGSGTTSSYTAGGIVSQGAAGGTISAGGAASAVQSQQAAYSTNNNVKGSVSGSLNLGSSSGLQAADNGGGVIGGSATGAYQATANSTKTGIFTSNYTANTAASGLSTTSAPSTTTWGNSGFSLSNQSTVTGGATSQAGTLTSSAPVTP